MVKIEDLNAEEYFMYNTMTSNIEASYVRWYWTFMILGAIGGLSITLEGSNLGNLLGTLLSLLMIGFTFIITYKQKKHVQKLFNIDKGFSFLK